MIPNNNEEQKEARLVSPYENKNVVDPGAVVNSFFTIVFEMIKTILIVGVLALTFRVFVVQPFIVDGHSMDPTLADKNYLLIDKISYRFNEPQRGDVIVFHYPKDERFNYIKRIIGLPGERIKITEKTVSIFNDEHITGLVLDEEYLLDPNGKKILDNRKLIDVEIPANHYYVMGDNRMGSSDSRSWGLVSRDEIIGRSLIRLFPLNNFSVIQHHDY